MGEEGGSDHGALNRSDQRALSPAQGLAGMLFRRPGSLTAHAGASVQLKRDG